MIPRYDDDEDRADDHWTEHGDQTVQDVWNADAQAKREMEPVIALSDARVHMDGKEGSYAAPGDPDGTKAGYDSESMALLEDLARRGWRLVRS